MKISEIIDVLEHKAPLFLQEKYDNAGLLTGDPDWECTGVLITLDTTEPVIEEAIKKKCNLVISHHPIIFSGIKKITGKNYVERTVIRAIKKDVAIYAIHTNLDNIKEGVNGKIAELIGLRDLNVLSPKGGLLKKLYTFVPVKNAPEVRQAIFNAGGGHIGNYSECSFNTSGVGTFKGGEYTNPYAGKAGELHLEEEMRVEIIFPAWLEHRIINILIKSHPYEEVAYDVISLDNKYQAGGSGLVGVLGESEKENDFLSRLQEVFNTRVIRHTRLRSKPVSKVAVCGGSGSFLISNALAAGADFFISADIKYHDFFDAEDKMVLADIGHYESEQFTVNLLQELLVQKFPTFAVLKTEVNTNPVNYFH